jgi:membrane protein YqaA with SNARE-associated domain
MHRLLATIQGAALAWGGPGLFLIAFLDSSFLSFPEVPDLLIIWLVTQHKDRLILYTLLGTVGSLLGCLAIYWVARKGGEAFLRKRFKEHHVDRGMALFQKYGLLVVMIPALLPPPAPFKIFVLLAGVVEVPVWQFVTAIVIVRVIRYGGLGLLAVFYGDQAAVFVKAHAREAGLWLAGAVLVLGAAWILWQRSRRATHV